MTPSGPITRVIAGPTGDPRARLVRHLPPHRAFRQNPRGPVDPTDPHAQRRPLLTPGNVALTLGLVAFALYATGNLPQFDAVFNHLDAGLRSHNDAIVSAILRLAPFLCFGLALAIAIHFGRSTWHQFQQRQFPER